MTYLIIAKVEGSELDDLIPHAFLTFYQSPATMESYGFYPGAGPDGTPGVVRNDDNHEYDNWRAFEVTEEQFLLAKAVYEHAELSGALYHYAAGPVSAVDPNTFNCATMAGYALAEAGIAAGVPLAGMSLTGSPQELEFWWRTIDALSSAPIPAVERLFTAVRPEVAAALVDHLDKVCSGLALSTMLSIAEKYGPEPYQGMLAFSQAVNFLSTEPGSLTVRPLSEFTVDELVSAALNSDAAVQYALTNSSPFIAYANQLGGNPYENFEPQFAAEKAAVDYWKDRAALALARGNGETSGGQYLDAATGIEGWSTTGSGRVVFNADTSSASEHADRLYGSATADVLTGGLGSDTLYGGGGDDWLGFSGADDALYSLEELQSLGNFYEGGTGADHIYGSGQVDTIRFNSGDGVDTIRGNGGADVLELNTAGVGPAVSREGKDLVLTMGVDRIVFREWYSDSPNDSPRLDRIELLARNADGSVQVDAEGKPVVTGIVSGETLTALGLHKTMPAGTNELRGDLDHYQETLVGSSESDIMYASTSYDGISGGDVLDGRGGDDQLYGSIGSDRVVLRAGDGKDRFLGNGGADIIELHGLSALASDTRLDMVGEDLLLTFGDGTQLSLVGWKGNPEKNLVVVKEESGTLVGAAQLEGLIKGFVGTGVAETLTGNGQDNDLVGLGGADELIGGQGSDTLNGGDGDDILVGDDDVESDLLQGGSDNDTYYAGASDVVSDADGIGQIYFQGVLITGGVYKDKTATTRVYEDAANGVLYTHNTVDKTLLVQKDGLQFTVENFENIVDDSESSSNLGLRLMADDETPASPGDIIGTPNPDTLKGTAGDDVIVGLASNDLLDGLAGNDVLIGGDGNDTLDGGKGSDVLRGGNGSDILGGALGDTDYDSGYGTSGAFVAGTVGNIYDGGAGNDTLRGTTASDLYLFNLGDGADTINEIEATTGQPIGAVDVLRFGEGINPSDIVVSRSGTALVLSHVNGTDKISIPSWYSNQKYQVEKVEFADGTAWSAADLTSWGLVVNGTEAANTLTGLNGFENALLGNGGNDTITGGNLADLLDGGAGDDILDGGRGADVLRGGDGNDTLGGALGDTDYDSGYGTSGAYVANTEGNVYEGGKGNDTLRGTVAADLYLFNLGDGADTINEIEATTGQPVGVVDVLRFGPDINPADIQVSRSGTTLVLSHVNGVDKVSIPSWYSNQKYRVEAVEFADGTVWTASDLTTWGLIVNGKETGETLTGLIGYENTLLGNGGNDTITGGNLGDVLEGGEGADTLDGGKGADLLSGGAGNDTLGGAQGGTSGDSGYGSSGAYVADTVGNIYEGGIGNDILRGTTAADLYLFDLGDGADTLNETEATTDQPAGVTDVLRFGPGISPADIIVSRSGTSLVLAHTNGTDKVTIPGWYQGSNLRQQVEVVEFDDGTVWTATDLTAWGLVVNGKDVTETLTGLNGYENTLLGNDGNDTITGGDRNDILDGGDGNDTLDGGKGADVLLGGAGNDTLGGSGTSGDSGMSGSTFIAGSLGNYYEGGMGNDTLRGTVLADTYVFNLGDGADAVTELDNVAAPAGQVDVLQFGPGIAPGDIVVVRSGTALVFAHVNGTDRVTVNNWFTSEGATKNQIERIVFDDGTAWNGADLTQHALTVNGSDGAETLSGLDGYANTLSGLAGNDVLLGGNRDDILHGGDGDDFLQGHFGRDTYIGGSGNDFLGYSPSTYGYGTSTDDVGSWGDNSGIHVLPGAQGNIYIGGTGNDKMHGTSSSDEYHFNLGDGKDAIWETAVSGVPQTDVLIFGGGILPQDVSVRYSDNTHTLTLKLENGQDSISFEETGPGSLRSLELVQFADGTTWTYDDLWAKATTFIGTAGADTIDGVNALPNFVQSGAGNDVISGGHQSDEIYGEAGDDTVSGVSGRDYIDGGDGNDRLSGGSLRDVFKGGAGNDTLGSGILGTDCPAYQRNGVWTLYGQTYEGNDYEGGTGNDVMRGTVMADVYRIGLGDGLDTIVEGELAGAPGGQTDVVKFGPGVLAENMDIRRTANNLVLTNKASGDVLTINNWYTTEGATANQIEAFEFYDGTVWSNLDLTPIGQANMTAGSSSYLL